MFKSVLATIIIISSFTVSAEPLQAQAGRDMAAAKAFASIAAHDANNKAAIAAANPNDAKAQQAARVARDAVTWAGKNVTRTAAAYQNAIALDAKNAAVTASQTPKAPTPAQIAAMNVAPPKQVQPVGVKTPVQSVPAVITNVPHPVETPFAPTTGNAGNHDHSGHSNGEHGTGNGGNNAANSASAHGLGGGSHIGGGSAMGGGFHGNW